MSLVEAHTGVERRHPRHEVVDADDLLLVARADGGAARVAAHAGVWSARRVGNPRRQRGITQGAHELARCRVLRITYGRSVGEREPKVHSLTKGVLRVVSRARAKSPLSLTKGETTRRIVDAEAEHAPQDRHTV
jgi:hypothetical protein